MLVRERGWSTRQVGQAINRGPMYVSRRLRVFEDATLAPLVLADKLAVSTAEELLVVADVQRRSDLALQAADEHWERPQVRAAARKCIAAIQDASLARRLDNLAAQLDQVDPDALGPRDRRAAKRLMASLRRLAGIASTTR